MRGSVLLHSPFADPVLWHAHEMVYGFTMAIVAGFLLTAVANWTGGETAKGGGLACLCALWLAGRAAMNLPGSYAVAAFLDLSFIPALALSLSIPLFRTRNMHNFIFLFMLGILFFCDLAIWISQARTPVYIALVAIMAMISAIGGRIIPSFTVAGLRRRGIMVSQTDQRKTDAAAMALLGLLALDVGFSGISSLSAGIIALAAAAAHAWRHRLYHPLQVWRDPMLWSLHAGHLWLVTGLAFLGLSSFGLMPLSPALHALTVGAIGTLTLSMMCRVALGHTGRQLKAGHATICAFVLMQGAALIRVFGPLLAPDFYLPSIEISGILWTAAFLVYIPAYMPVLWQKRPDGLPA
jgi:uncharacterized protein involved in response to NO